MHISLEQIEDKQNMEYMENIALWQVYLITSTFIGILVIGRTKNASITEKFIWILSVLIFNIFAILAFFIWRKSAKKA